MRITLDWLKEHHACGPQLDVFAKEWPEGVDLSLASLRRAAELLLNVDWLADIILPSGVKDDYHKAMLPALRAYHAAAGPVVKAYTDAEAPLFRKYMDEREAASWPVAYQSYSESIAPLWEARQAAVNPHLKLYYLASAEALWSVLQNMKEP